MLAFVCFERLGEQPLLTFGLEYVKYNILVLITLSWFIFTGLHFSHFACIIKKRLPMYTLWHRYNNIYRYNMCFFLASDKMCLSVFELLRPPRAQSLVHGFSLAGAEVVGAAGGGGLWGGKAGRGRDPGVNVAVDGVLSLEPSQWGAR